MSQGKGVDFLKLPEHIAIIMDGNGRWASKRMLTKNVGHKAGAEALRRLAERMNGKGFKYLTVDAFSTENWTRPEDEVKGLMALLRDYIQQYIDDSKKNDMRIHVIGDMTRLDEGLQEKIRHLLDITKDNKGLFVTIAINYGGRDDIVRTARRLCAEAVSGKISPEGVNQNLFASYMDTHMLPEPELLIRTSGEARLSNFFLWQAAYSEFYLCDKLWPDFSYDDLLLAVEEYQKRDRRFGGRKLLAK